MIHFGQPARDFCYSIKDDVVCKDVLSQKSQKKTFYKITQKKLVMRRQQEHQGKPCLKAREILSALKKPHYE